MKRVTLEVNGKKIDKEIPDHTILSVLLRDILNLTGTHIGCDTSQCGACVVHVDGKSIKSCTAFAADLNGSKITIPKAYFKSILLPDSSSVNFIVSHTLKNGEVQEKFTSINHIESKLGIDLFEGLPDSLENKLTTKNKLFKLLE